MDVVPMIDLGRIDAAARIGEACEHVGFFQITGHGVSQSISDAAWDAAGAFFDLPLEDRMRVAMPHAGYPYGYQPFEGERLASSLGAATPPDRKHTFSIGPIENVPHVVTDPDEVWIRSPNQWPFSPDGFRDVMHAYYRALGVLSAQVMSLMAEALRLPSDFFEPFIGAHTSALRLLDYPHSTVPPLPGQLRAGAHTDYGTLTFLRQEQAPGGLEVMTTDDRWVGVDPVPDAFVVNVGDCLARWTNDRWRSTLHRVVNPPPDVLGSTRRRSIAFFHNANWDAEIACIPTCLMAGETARYSPIRAGRHLMDKFVSTVT